MSLYRGAGGASDATDDSTVNAVAGYASSAASSAAAAAGSASAADTSASAAATSASNASTSASSVASNATNASNSASLAGTYAAAADISKNSAAASADIATTQAGLASSSASSASSSAATASSRAVAVTFSVTACANSATAAANSAASALAIYGDTAAVDAAVASAADSASTAATQAGLASASAASADSSETASFENAQNAAEWASTAQGAANDAQASATYAAQVVLTVADASADAASAAASAATATTQAELAAASAASASAVVLGNEPVRPTIKPTLLLDFANTEQLDPRITFTRASTATYYGSQTAKAEENLILQSQTLTAGSWGSTNATVTADTAAAPDGTTTADTVTDTIAAQAHVHAQNIVTVAGLSYTLSFFLKASTNNFAIVTLSSTTAQNYISAIVDLTSGVITQTSTGTSATAGVLYSESVGNGWHRVVITGSCTAGFTRAEMGLALAATGNTFATNGRTTYTGTGTSIFVWGAQLEQRSTATAYTPTTTQTITNYIPQLLTAASGVARFDHNPITGESLGLEIEEQRTNLLTYSDQFSNAAWTKSRSSITANTIVAPDGTLTGDKLVEDTATGSHTVRNATSVTIVSGTTLTASVFVKAAEGAFVIVGIGDGGGINISRTTFNLSTGVIDSSANAAANVSVPIPVITPVGNGWYRCAVTATVTGVTTAQQWIFKGSNATGAANYTGDGISGIYIWGAQLEAGLFVTSYIPTVASQVTRAADVAVMTGTNFSTWYNQGEGTFYAQFRPMVSNFGANKNMFLATDNTTGNFVGLRYASSGAQAALAATTSGTSQANIATGTMVAGTSYKIAGVYKVNDFAASRDNATVGTDTTGTIPVVDRAEIGCLAGTAIGSQHIAKLAYYPLRVTNAQLQAMTTV